MKPLLLMEGIMVKYMVLILGGARSGKSDFAEKLALKLRKGEETIGYLATAEEAGKDFKQRILIHKANRGSFFKTFETPLDISGKIEEMEAQYRIILLECLTVWLGNLFYYHKSNQIEPEVDRNLEKIASFWCKGYVKEETFQSVFDEGQSGFKIDAKELLNPESKILIIVSNELGMGIVPADEETRLYRDIHGRMNRKIASTADFVYFICAGIPRRLK